MIDVMKHRADLNEIGSVDFEGTPQEKADFFEDVYNKSYAIALALVEAIEEANEKNAEA